MKQACMRRHGVRAKVRLLLALLLGRLLVSTPVCAAVPFTLADTDNEPGVVVYPARAPGVRDVTVLLHGMCGEPQNACRHFAQHVTAREHLVCPRASRENAQVLCSRGLGLSLAAAVLGGGGVWYGASP